MSPQLSCGDTCQIWMWFEESNMYFCETEIFAYGEINERSFSNPHPWSVSLSLEHNGLKALPFLDGISNWFFSHFRCKSSFCIWLSASSQSRLPQLLITWQHISKSMYNKCHSLWIVSSKLIFEYYNRHVIVHISQSIENIPSTVCIFQYKIKLSLDSQTGISSIKYWNENFMENQTRPIFSKLTWVHGLQLDITCGICVSQG